MLTVLGYEGAAARDGSEALRLYADTAGRGQPFDLVILDLTIPGGIGGLETFKLLKSRHPAARGVVMSRKTSFSKCGFSQGAG